MEGAREYASLFKTGQHGNLYLVSGIHAKGKTFRIYILPSGEEAIPNGAMNPPVNKNAVEVYGVVSGQLGWTEKYDWIHDGPWQEDFFRLVDIRKEEIKTTFKKEFPMFPELTEAGANEAQVLIEKFRTILKNEAAEVIENIMGEFYCDILPYIESDSWTNFRNEIMDGYKNYPNRKIQGEYDFKEIRKVIFDEFKDEIIEDLNQDHLKEIKSLRKQIEDMIKIRS